VDNWAGEIAIEDRTNVDNMEDQANKQEFGNVIIPWRWGRTTFGYLLRHIKLVQG
jgi:hypothetical protein